MKNDKYPEGTICRIDSRIKSSLPKSYEDDYVYIKKAKSFNKYECYSCDVYGEIKDFVPTIISGDHLFKRTNFPHLGDDDLVTCIKILAAFKTLSETKQIDLAIINELADEFSIFTHKVTLNVLVGKIL